MDQGCSDFIAVSCLKVIYTYLWYFHVNPIWTRQWLKAKGVVAQSWYAGTKSLAIFVGKLNQYYLSAKIILIYH